MHHWSCGNSCVSFLVSLLALVSCATARQNDDTEFRRFLSVPRWFVTYTVSVRGSYSSTDPQGRQRAGVVSRAYRGGFVTNIQTPDPSIMGMALRSGLSDVVWAVRPDKTGRNRQSVYVRVVDEDRSAWEEPIEGPQFVMGHRNSRSSGEGITAAAGSGAVAIDLKAGTFGVGLPWGVSRGSGGQQVNRATKWQEWDDAKKQIQSGQRQDFGGFDGIGGPGQKKIPERNLPAGGLDLSGSWTYREPWLGSGSRIAAERYFTVTVSWSCSPDPPADVELQLDPVDYENWRPGGPPGQPIVSEGQPIPDSALRVLVELVDPMTGGPPKVAARRFKAELVDVSRHPGVCINAPLRPANPPDFDLKIDSGFGWIPGRYGQTAEHNWGTSSAVMAIQCYDYGASGILKVTAELVDGREITGFLIGHPKQREVLIPRRRDKGTLIATPWQETHKKLAAPDDADDENEPVGDGTKGDGLTLFEEYRGLSYDGRWQEALPEVKELYICDEAPSSLARRAALMLSNASGVQVWINLRPEELDSKRVINFNGREGPHVADQHAILIKHLPGNSLKPRTTASPKTPKNVIAIEYGDDWRPAGQRQEQLRIRALAQVMAYCINVGRHGDLPDRVARWTLRSDAAGRPWVEEEGYGRILVVNERGQPLSPDELGLAPGASRKLVIGVPHGPHSGDEKCLMRWAYADCYVGQGDPNLRYWISGTEIMGDQLLCSSPAGTGCNDPAHAPQPRYGGATRGNCIGLIRVSDK